MPTRVLFFAYGLMSYALFFATFLYAAGFVGGIAVPKAIDTPPAGPLGEALLINTLLLTVFAAQHSIMARPWFKQLWTRIIPKPIERSTYVLAASLALDLLFWQWRPIGGTVWDVQNTEMRAAILAVYGLGFATVFISTCLIDHFELFGLRQVYLALRGHAVPPAVFRTPGFYQFLRHPIYLGFMIAFWAAPTMTPGRLFFAVVTTVYILTAIQWEESDLVREFGNRYLRYRESVPMLLPVRAPRQRPVTFTPDRAATEPRA